MLNTKISKKNLLNVYILRYVCTYIDSCIHSLSCTSLYPSHGLLYIHLMIRPSIHVPRHIKFIIICLVLILCQRRRMFIFHRNESHNLKAQNVNDEMFMIKYLFPYQFWGNSWDSVIFLHVCF